MSLLQPMKTLITGTSGGLGIKIFVVRSDGLEWIQSLFSSKLLSQQIGIKRKAGYALIVLGSFALIHEEILGRVSQAS